MLFKQKRKSHLKPLENRTFIYKNPTMRFFCPLCRTERNFTSTPRLTKRHFLQIIMTTVVLMLLLYPLMQFKSIFSFFIVWMSFELGVRLNFKKQIPCEHCGFDACWYHRDIPTTRRRVQEFWDKREAVKTGAIQEEANMDKVTHPIKDESNDATPLSQNL